MAAEGELLTANEAAELAEPIYGWKPTGQTIKNYMRHGRTPRGRKKNVLLRSKRVPVNGRWLTTVAWMKEHASRFPPLQ